MEGESVKRTDLGEGRPLLEEERGSRRDFFREEEVVEEITRGRFLAWAKSLDRAGSLGFVIVAFAFSLELPWNWA